ncbi:acyltransferase domain-containing protein [Paenibacillus sp. HJGM_3]|uniref:acyltransferase domain-containing protein n=1 Tax=Paenibacillus sp. HJGM_3 TaxID=3379816 RepID=UPI00385CAFFA
MATEPILATVAEALELPAVPDSWSVHWEAATASYPGAGTIEFLQPGFIRSAGAYARLPQDKLDCIVQTADLIVNDENWARLAWLWHYILFVARVKGEPVGAWPMPANRGPLAAGLFPAVVLLSGTPRLQALHAERGIPEAIVADTMWDVNNSMNIFERRNGRPGMGMRYMGWLMNHYRAELYRLGRLQFGIRMFGQHVHVYRHTGDGRITALSAPGLIYRRDGLIDGTNNRFDLDHRWTAILQEHDGRITGHPISEDGYASRETVTLDLAEWQCILTPGDPVYDVHIPADGRLTADLYEASYVQASPFYSTHYPELKFKAYVCSSWLLDPQLRTLLPRSANIVQFQSQFHLYPIGGGDDSFYNFLFDCNVCPVEQLPEQSSMQRTVKDYMLRGGQMRAMGGFKLLP